jgi:hypothetical protein
MSRGLQRVVDNFVKGLSMGWTHQDRQADRQAKLDMAKFQREKWAQQADLKRQEMGISSRKADAYVGLSGAQADYYRRKGAGGGGAAKSTDINPSTAAWLNQSGGETLSTTQPAPPTLVTQESMPAGPAPPPGGEGGGITLDDAQGGKIPKRFARGGMGERAAAAFTGGMQNSWRMANQRAQQARTPPINPDPRQRFDPNAPSIPIGYGGGPSIQRTSSTPLAVSPQPDGSTGPGSGFGIMAAPPVSGMGYQRGGRVQRFADGGTPDPGKPSLLSVMADAFGHRFGVQNLGDRFRDRRPPPQNPPPTSSTPGPGQPLPPRFTDDDRAASTAWAENQGGPPQVKRTDRDMTQIRPHQDEADYRPGPLPQQAQPTGPLPAYDNVYPKFDIDPSKIVQPTAAPARTGGGGGGGGGGGYQARGGGLGDQRRTAAYDPVADRMDPRNTGIVYAPGEAPAGVQGNVNQQVYAAAQHGGIELNQPGQQIYRRGGPVRRFETGGKARFAKDEPRLINPRVTPGMADIPVGRGRASLGLNYDPSSKYGSVEGGYEHPVGRDTTLGVYGNIGKDLGPEGASAKPEWGVGVRGRVRFADGGEVPGMALPPPPNQLPGGGDDTGMTGVRKREESGGGGGGRGAGGGFGGFDFGGGDGSAGTGGVGGSADDGSGGSAAAGVGGDDGGTYRRGGRVQRFAGGGAPVT